MWCFVAPWLKRHSKVSSVCLGWRGKWFCFRVNQEAREGGVPALVAVDGETLVLLTVQPNTVTLAKRQQQTLTLHLPPLGCILIIHHGLHLTFPGHQLHRNSLTRMLPHGESEEVSPWEVAGEPAWGFVEMASNIDIFYIKAHRHLGLMPATLTHERGGPRNREGRPRLLGCLIFGLKMCLRRAVWVGQAYLGQVVADCGDFRVDEVTREGDVRTCITVQSVLRTLL